MLFNINIFRKFEKCDSQNHEIMGGLRLIQPQGHSLSTLKYMALKFSENVFVESTKIIVNKFSINIALSPSKRQRGLAN